MAISCQQHEITFCNDYLSRTKIKITPNIPTANYNATIEQHINNIDHHSILASGCQLVIKTQFGGRYDKMCKVPYNRSTYEIGLRN